MRPVILAGLVAPAGVLAIAGLVWIAFGAPWAIAVLVVGGGAIVAFHLWQLDQLARWADATLDLPVPEGRGSWRIAFSALHRRARARTAYQRDLTQTIERFRSVAEAIPDGMVVLDTANRIRWANARALAHLGLDLAHDAGQPLTNLVRQPEVVRYLDTGDFSDAVDRRFATHARRDAVDPGRAVRRGREALHQPRHHAARVGRADAARLHRQRLARTEDAAHGGERFSRNGAGPGPLAAAARPVSCS